MHRAQPQQSPPHIDYQVIRAELDAVRELLREVAAARLRIAKHHAALRLGGQLALVILALREDIPQR